MSKKWKRIVLKVIYSSGSLQKKKKSNPSLQGLTSKVGDFQVEKNKIKRYNIQVFS